MNYVIGGGMTGLAAGMASGFPVLERDSGPGGICDSYECEGYRFETGGGHWIYGSDPIVNRLLAKASELKSYKRRSGVLFFGGTPCTRDFKGLIVPYPIQDNLFALPPEIRRQVLSEIMESKITLQERTMDGWLDNKFGSTLGQIFFQPFHDRYTDGLFRTIAPQDGYKSPIDKERIKLGAERENSDAGYNATFLYPSDGLDSVCQWLSQRCDIRYGDGVAQIHPETSTPRLEMASGKQFWYETVVSTMPLDLTVKMAGLESRVGSPDPHTSVLVINLGVTLPDTPEARHGYHWLYTPDSCSGFHRIGYYSNVDPLFLPKNSRRETNRGSLYVETAFCEGHATPKDFVDSVVAELKQHELIEHVEVCDPTWIDRAYTWRLPGSDWVERATRACEDCGIIPAGRYGRWNFQGVAGSLKEGLLLGSVLRASADVGAVL
jgi:protoporphyrinogen oxidase